MIRLNDFTSGEHTIKQVTGVLGIANGGTGALTAAEALSNLGLTATATELNYCDGVTSNIQTQLNNKQGSISGAATTVTSSNLTANKALISNGSGKIAVSDTTSTELGYLSGTASNFQNQINDLSTSKVGYSDDLIIDCGTSIIGV